MYVSVVVVVVVSVVVVDMFVVFSFRHTAIGFNVETVTYKNLKFQGMYFLP